MILLDFDPAVNPTPADLDAPADIEPTGPSADDAAWWAGQNTEWHSEEPEPDWDALADEAEALGRHEAGCLL